MADGKELKPKSFRIDDETAEKFKEIAVAIGGNQQQTLAKLIESYEFQSGKVALSEKKADIEQFENHVNILTRMFMRSLEDNQNMTETIRTEFDALLKSKDVTIQHLQEQLTVAKQQKEEAAIEARSYKTENKRLNALLDEREKDYSSRMDELQKTLNDKEGWNKTLTDSCNSLKEKVEEMKEAAKQAIVIQEELSQLKKEHDTIISERVALEKRLEQEQAAHEKSITDLQQHEADMLERSRERSQLALEQAVLKVKSDYQEQIQTIKEQKQAEVDKYQQKYFALLEQIQSTSTKKTSKKTTKQATEQ